MHEFAMVIRSLRRSPGYSAAVIAVLVLGIGVNSAVFSVLDRVVIRPLPFRDPGKLAVLWEDFSAFGAPKQRVSPATFLDWRSRNRTFAGLAAYSTSVTTVTGYGEPDGLHGVAATADLLPMIGVAPIAGRVFSPDEEHSRVAVVSYRVWQGRLGGRSIPGTELTMNGQRFVVIGVMPPGFNFPDGATDYWIPLVFTPAQAARRNSHYLHVVGRMRPDRSLAEVRTDMDAIARQLAAEFPETNTRVGVVVTSLKDEALAGAALSLTVLLAAAACVLLIACANVANLALVRGAWRQHEIAVRLALGASAGRLIRDLLVESAMLTAAGTIGALLFARWAVSALGWLVPPLTGEVNALDGHAVLFTLAIAATTALSFGVAPALVCASRRLPAPLAAIRGRGTAGNRARSVLVVTEVALAVLLVAAAGLLMDTLLKLRAVDGGFNSENVLTADITVPYPKYSDPNVRKRFFEQVVISVAKLPGVDSVGLASDLPYTSRGNTMAFEIERRPHSVGSVQDALFRLVSGRYLQTIGARLVAGRLLDDGDGQDSPPAVVINQALARQYWPDGDALGHRINTGTGTNAPLWLTIVGVVADIRERGPDLASKPAVYVPFAQTEIAFFQPSELAVRTSVAPMSLAAAVRRAIRALDPEQPVSNVRTMADIVSDELASRRQMLTLLATFAMLALVLAAVGVYAVLSYAVAQSSHEIGIRIAIGASAGSVIRFVLARAGALAGAGIAVGLAAAAVVTRLLTSLLYDVSPLDPGVLLASAAILGAVALIAAYVPARRAAAIDPIAALRAE